MSTATLKLLTGEAGAGIDESHGAPDRLYLVLKAMAESGNNLDAHQATIATATIGGRVVENATKIRNFSVNVAVTGTAGDTDIDVEVNGSVVASLTVDNTDADGTTLSSGALTLDVPAGALVAIVVSAAPTAGTGLTASVRLDGVTVE